MHHLLMSRYRTHARTSWWRHKQRYNGACHVGAIGGATVLMHWHVVKSLQLIWSSSTCRWNLQMSDLQMSCSELKTGYRDSNSSNIYHSDRPYFTRSPEPNWVFWCVFFPLIQAIYTADILSHAGSIQLFSFVHKAYMYINTGINSKA